MADKKTQQNSADRPLAGDVEHLSAARISRDESPFRSMSGSVDTQANSAIAASIIGLGLANQIVTDQGQASVILDDKPDEKPAIEVQSAAATPTIAPDQPSEQAPVDDLIGSGDQAFDLAFLTDIGTSAPQQPSAEPGSLSFAPPLGEPFHQSDLTKTSLDPTRPVSAPILSAAPPAAPGSADQAGGRAPVANAPADGAVAQDASEPVTSGVLSPILGQDGLLQPVTDLLQPVLGQDGVVGNLVEDVVLPILDPILGPDGLLDVILGPDGVLAPVTGLLQPILGQDGLIGQIVGGVTPVLGQILGQGGLLSPVTNILAPVLGEGGAVGQVIASVTGVLDPILDGVLSPVTEILAPVLGEDGVVGDLIETVSGVLNPVIENVVAPITGILTPVLGGVFDTIGLGSGLGAPEPETGSVVAAIQDVPGDVIETVLPVVSDTVQTIAAPILGEGGVLDALVGQGGILSGLLGALDPTETTPDHPEADFLDTLIGSSTLDDAGAGDDLPSVMDMLLSDAPLDLSQTVDAGEDVLASLLDLPDLSGLLVGAGIMGADAGVEHAFAPDPDIDNLLNEILDSADRPLAGISDPVEALLDFGNDETDGGIFADAAVENALGIIFGEAATDTDARESNGSLLDTLTELVSPDDQP